MGNEQSSPESRRRRQNEQRNNRNFSHDEVERALERQRKEYEKRMQEMLRKQSADSHSQQTTRNVQPLNNLTTRAAAQLSTAPKFAVPRRPPPPTVQPSTSDSSLSERQRHPYSYTKDNLTDAVKTANTLYPNLNNNVSSTSSEFVMVNNNGKAASVVPDRFTTVTPVPSAPPLPRSAAYREAARSRSRNEDEGICCPTCNNRFGVKIFNCSSGHASCLECMTQQRACARCGLRITEMRNITMEEYVSERKVPCPHADEGCCLNFKIGEVENHLNECPFKETQCLLPGGKCKWKGKLSRMAQHFDNFHPNHRQSDVDTEQFLHNICSENWTMQLITIGNFMFVFHLQVSEADRRIYIAVQLLGTQISANKWSYEIHVYNKREPRRKYQFTDKCFSIGESIEDIIKESACAVLPLQHAVTFVNEGALAYKFFIKKDNFRNYDETQRDVSCNRRVGRGGRGRGAYRKY